MIPHQQREPAIVKAIPDRQHRHAVFELPLGVVGEVDRHAARCAALDRVAHAVGLVADDNLEGSDARFGRSVERSQDERLAQHRLEQLGLARAVLKPVAVAGCEYDGVPHGDGRN